MPWGLICRGTIAAPAHPGLPQDAHWLWSSACECHTASSPPHLHGVVTPPLLGTRSSWAWPGPEGPRTVQQLWCWDSCTRLGQLQGVLASRLHQEREYRSTHLLAPQASDSRI